MLTHYIFVRRDLPVGVIAAQVVHAAGESAALREYEYWAYHEGDYNFGHFEGATAVVLEARDEDHLFDIRDQLVKDDLDHVEVFESGGIYHDQFMAIGLIPRERTELMKPYQTLKSCLDNPPPIG